MPQRAFAVFFFIVVLAFSFAVWSGSAATRPIIAENITAPNVLQLTPAPEASNSAEEYTLPYPGILPDHPLYKIKLLRDRILDFLIRDPVKRIEFNLLMSDKRLMMGVALADKGKDELAEETISKGEKYFVKALDEFQRSKNEGRAIPGDLSDRLEKSAVKHVLVIEPIASRAPSQAQEGYMTSLALARENVKRMGTLSL